MVSRLQVWERRDRWSVKCKCERGQIDGQPSASEREDRQMVSQVQVWERRDRWSANCKCGTGEIDGQPTASVGEER